MSGLLHNQVTQQTAAGGLEAGAARWGWYKRLFDLALLLSAHILLLPAWLLLWSFIPAMIWLGDRGPVFYRQTRIGKDGRTFTVRKFRTMVVDADRNGPAWTSESDARVTRVGRVLRKTALDELPELLCIWKGEMSFVGPRALDAGEQRMLEQEIPGFNQRLRVRPGLTGLSQIYNREDEARAKLQFDLDYIRRMSPLLDLKTLLLSVRNTLLARWDTRGGKPPPSK